MSFQKDYENYLMHYGVKGMRWGIRKDRYKSMSRCGRKAHRQMYRALSKPFKPGEKEALLKDQKDSLSRVQSNYDRHKKQSLIDFVMDISGRSKAEATAEVAKYKKDWKNEYDYTSHEFEGSISYLKESIKRLESPETKSKWDWMGQYYPESE